MTLVEKQIAFQRDLRLLMSFIESKGFTFTIGEVYRTKDQQALFYQQGKTHSLSNQHMKKLAASLLMSEDSGEFMPIWDREVLIEVGDYWEALHPDNVWGGSWNSPNVTEFQRNG